MNTSIEEMLKKYNANSPEDKKNAIKEIMQEIVLSGLSRGGFFNKAAFYGGTALRIFYGLDRFSEDLDFSLMTPDADFNLSAYFPMLEKELASYGFKVEITEKEKNADSAIKSAFLKGNTKEHMLIFYPGEGVENSIPANEVIKIKFEIDVDPPKYAGFEHKYKLLPSPYEINMYDFPSLFAGKIHAVLCRGWKNRVKGRDLFDYVFYLSKGAAVNLDHLKARLIDSGVLSESDNFDIDILREMLCDRFQSIDYESANDDVKNFIRNKKQLEIWKPEFFIEITKLLEGCRMGEKNGNPFKIRSFR